MTLYDFIKGKYGPVSKFFITGIFCILFGLTHICLKHGYFKNEDFVTLKEKLYTLKFGHAKKKFNGKNADNSPYLTFSSYQYWFVDFSSGEMVLINNKNNLLKEVLPGDTVIFAILKSSLKEIKDQSPYKCEIYSFGTTDKTFLNLDINALNADIDNGKKRTGYFLIVTGLIFNLLGFRKYKKLKNGIPRL